MHSQMKHHPAGNRVAVNNQAATLKLDGEPTNSVANMSADQWSACMSYYASGYSRGIERGRVLADEDARQLWREAGAMVRGLAGRDARPGTDWMQFATSEQLTDAAEQRQTDDIARFRATHAVDRAIGGVGPTDTIDEGLHTLQTPVAGGAR